MRIVVSNPVLKATEGAKSLLMLFKTLCFLFSLYNETYRCV